MSTTSQGGVTPRARAPRPAARPRPAPGARAAPAPAAADRRGARSATCNHDPDGNDLELCWDRPVEQWPRDADGHLFRDAGRDLDLDALLGRLGP